MSRPNPRSVSAAKMVLAALGDVREGRGASKEELTEHIESNYSVPNKDFCKYLNKALEKGIAFGAIKKMRGRYCLGDIMDCVREHRRRRRSRSKSGRRHKGGRRRRRRRSKH